MGSVGKQFKWQHIVSNMFSMTAFVFIPTHAENSFVVTLYGMTNTDYVFKYVCLNI